jgi:hypothetical protein
LVWPEQDRPQDYPIQHLSEADALQQQITDLKNQLAQQQKRLTRRSHRSHSSESTSSTSSDSSDDSKAATDEEDEGSCRRANNAWLKHAKQLDATVRATDAYASLNVTNDAFIAEWRRRLRPHRTTPQWIESEAERWVSLLAHAHRALLGLRQVDEKAIYASAKSLRLLIEFAGSLILQINRINGDGYNEYWEQLAIKRAKNRRGNGFVSLDHILSRITNNKKFNVQSRGNRRSHSNGAGVRASTPASNTGGGRGRGRSIQQTASQ